MQGPLARWPARRATYRWCMPYEPIACSLTEDAAQRQVDEWARLRADAIAVETVAGGVEMVFPARVAATVEDLARREAACCTFLDLTTVRAHDTMFFATRDLLDPVEQQNFIQSRGIDPQRFYEYFDQDYFDRHGLGPAIHFGQSNYPRSATLPDVLRDWIWKADRRDVESAIDSYPLSRESKASLQRLLFSEADHLAGRSLSEKNELLQKTSYIDFLTKYVGVTDEVALLIRDKSKSLWGFDWSSLSALEAYRLGEPGTYEMGLEPPADSSYTSEEPYIFHFPDGNAGIARALVRDLLPQAVPGSTMEDLVPARIDYDLLDDANPTRIRLNSTAVDVRHTNDNKHVDVCYVRAQRHVERVRAKHVIMACYNSVVPYICPDIGEAQSAAIGEATKTPLTYINVALRNWHSFERLGCHRIYVPQAELMHEIRLDFPVSMGDYKFSPGPASPVVLHCVHAPTRSDPDLDFDARLRAGRQRMLELTWDDYETAIVAELESALGGGGFDAVDIAGITVNRWPHGYAREFVDLYDPPDFYENGSHVAGRAQLGRISIANSDAEASAYMDAAIDAAVRAVAEQLSTA